MNNRRFFFGSCKFFLSFGYFFYYFPNSSRSALFHIKTDISNFVCFYIKESKVSKDIINLRTPQQNLYVHLMLVYTVAVSSSFFRDYGCETRFVKAFIRSQMNKCTLLYSLWKPIQNIEQSV